MDFSLAFNEGKYTGRRTKEKIITENVVLLQDLFYLRRATEKESILDIERMKNGTTTQLWKVVTTSVREGVKFSNNKFDFPILS